MKKYFLIFACVSMLLNCGDSGIGFTLSNHSIHESSAAGTSIGTLKVIHPQDKVTYTFTLSAPTDKAFEIVGDQLVVANGALLDFETAKTHDVTIKTTGSDKDSSEQKFTIDVLDVTLEVTNLDDSGTGSLRKIIADAPSGSRIGFKASLKGTIALATPISVDKKLTILSPGSSIIAISGETLGDVIDITSSGDVTISGVTIENANGAGIYNTGGTFTISNSTIKNNAATTFGYGGGVFNSGTATIRNCTFTGNSAFNGGGLGNGAGDMFVYDSTISGNSTTGNSGAGIANSSNLTVVNSTISDNTVTGTNRVGGGIGCFGPPASVELYNVTITGNTATQTGGLGGGIYAGDCTLKIKNSLIAKNTSVAGGSDIYLNTGGVITSKEYNLIGKNTDNTFVNDSNHDQVGTAASPLDPKLKTLADNGGFTKTLAFSSSTSPAIDQIPASFCKDDKEAALTKDQRGYLRPVNSQCDIGAFEAQ
jgi:hypothetical protein